MTTSSSVSRSLIPKNTRISPLQFPAWPCNGGIMAGMWHLFEELHPRHACWAPLVLRWDPFVWVRLLESLADFFPPGLYPTQASPHSTPPGENFCCLFLVGGSPQALMPRNRTKKLLKFYHSDLAKLSWRCLRPEQMKPSRTVWAPDNLVIHKFSLFVASFVVCHSSCFQTPPAPWAACPMQPHF